MVFSEWRVRVRLESDWSGTNLSKAGSEAAILPFPGLQSSLLCNRIQWNLRGEGGRGRRRVTTLTAKVTIFGV